MTSAQVMPATAFIWNRGYVVCLDIQTGVSIVVMAENLLCRATLGCFTAFRNTSHQRSDDDAPRRASPQLWPSVPTQQQTSVFAQGGGR
jgi:hypothetical protein